MSTLTHPAPATARLAARVAPAADSFNAAGFACVAVLVTAAWVAIIVWALTFVPAIVWAGLGGALVAGVAGLRAWCDIVHGTAR